MSTEPTEAAEDAGAGAHPQRRRRLVVIACVAALLVIAAALTIRSSGHTPARPAGAAPAISLPDLTDPSRTRSLAALAGRPVIVNLFASWCVPCRRELPALQAASIANPDVAFLGVDHQDSARAARNLLHETGVTYPAAFDPGGTTAAAYRARGMPTTIAISATGTVAGIHVGELDRQDIDALIQKARHP